MRIAILDDDQNLLDLTVATLKDAGHVCHPFSSGKAMLHQLHRESFDLLILDWQVPDLSGTEILQWVREKLSSTLPVLFMTNRSAEDDIVAGLAAGADDYMIKPFDPYVFLARVNALLRREICSTPRRTLRTISLLRLLMRRSRLYVQRAA